MGNCYAFFVRTGCEDEVRDILNSEFRGDIIAFVPKIEIPFVRSGKEKLQLKVMYPGYVLLITNMTLTELYNRTSELVKRFRTIYKLLGVENENYNYSTISDQEKETLLSVLDENYILRKSIGFIVNDKIIITDGPFAGKEGMIIKVDRHQRKAYIRLSAIKNDSVIKIGLEIVKKIRL